MPTLLYGALIVPLEQKTTLPHFRLTKSQVCRNFMSGVIVIEKYYIDTAGVAKIIQIKQRDRSD